MHLICGSVQLADAPPDSGHTGIVTNGMPGIHIEHYVRAARSKDIDEILPLYVDNRIELYAVLAHEKHQDVWEQLTTQMLGRLHGEELLHQQTCVEHFFRRFVGLHSTIPGDTTVQFHIEEQVSQVAQWGGIGPVLARILREAIETAGEIHNNTHLSAGSATVADAIPEIIAKIMEQASSVLILGRNEYVLPIIESLAEAGFERLFFAHPDMGIAHELALNDALYSLTDAHIRLPIEWEQRHEMLAECDVVITMLTPEQISGTKEATPCITLREAQSHLDSRKNRPLVIVDCSSEGGESEANIDPGFYQQENVFIYTLSDLEKVVQQNIQRRRRTIPQAQKRIAKRAQICMQRLYGKDRYLFDGMIARSPVMHTVLELTRRAATSDANILIQGETGTGKELIARAIHRQSHRAEGSFVTINCGAIPEDLLESELFGHVKGSFTGAMSNKQGLLEQAHHGTLLLDEIGDMSLPLQVKLLRAIQEGEIRSVGSTEQRTIDVRIVASTHRDLEELIQEGTFREDLYYRLNVIRITVPPLRERREDILPLAEAFLRRFAAPRRSFGRPDQRTLRLQPEVERCLLAYEWPGNVRELENVIERAVALSFGGMIRIESLPSSLCQQPAQGQVTPEQLIQEAMDQQYSLRELEAQYIEQVLKASDWNHTLATQILGISRTTLWRKMNDYGISKE